MRPNSGRRRRADEVPAGPPSDCTSFTVCPRPGRKARRGACRKLSSSGCYARAVQYPSCKDFMWMPARRKLAAGYCKISGSPEIYLEDSCWHHDGLETVTFLSHCNAHIGAS